MLYINLEDWYCDSPLILSGGKWGFKCLLLRFKSAKAYLCKQATGACYLLIRFNWLILSWLWCQLITCVTAGSSVSRYGCCLEPWSKLISFIWFLWHSYRVEEIKDGLGRTYTQKPVTDHTLRWSLSARFCYSFFIWKPVNHFTKCHIEVLYYYLLYQSHIPE